MSCCDVPSLPWRTFLLTLLSFFSSFFSFVARSPLDIKTFAPPAVLDTFYSFSPPHSLVFSSSLVSLIPTQSCLKPVTLRVIPTPLPLSPSTPVPWDSLLSPSLPVRVYLLPTPSSSSSYSFVSSGGRGINTGHCSRNDATLRITLYIYCPPLNSCPVPLQHGCRCSFRRTCRGRHRSRCLLRRLCPDTRWNVGVQDRQQLWCHCLHVSPGHNHQQNRSTSTTLRRASAIWSKHIGPCQPITLTLIRNP